MLKHKYEFLLIGMFIISCTLSCSIGFLNKSLPNIGNKALFSLSLEQMAVRVQVRKFISADATYAGIVSLGCKWQPFQYREEPHGLSNGFYIPKTRNWSYYANPYYWGWGSRHYEFKYVSDDGVPQPLALSTVEYQIPTWSLFLLAAMLKVRKELTVIRKRDYRCCPACGYDLRGTPERCPECGRETTAAGNSKGSRNSRKF